LKWVKSNDFRLIPEELLKKSSNPYLEAKRFYTAANVLLENPLLFVVYGLNDQHRIESALIGVFGLIDGCINVDNMFGCDLEDEGLKEALRKQQEHYQAKAVRLIKTKDISLGGD
jgi:hypothetical protein